MSNSHIFVVSEIKECLYLCTSIFADVLWKNMCTAKISNQGKLPSVFLFSGHEPIYFTENKEKTLRVSYDRDTHTIEYMN